MPFNSQSKPFNQNEFKYYSIGEAVADWKTSTENFERVQGILVDVNYLISNAIRPNYSEINALSQVILDSIEKNKGNH